jgi:AsmA-like C-terminal region
VQSTLDVSPLAKIWPKNPPEVLKAFSFDQPPSLTLTGHFDTPGEIGDVHKDLHLEARTDSPFRFHGFALDRTAFTAEVHDDDFVLEPFAVGFAGGAVTGHVQVRGAGQPDGRINVTAALRDANLLRAVELVQNYSPKGPAPKPAPLSEFVRNLANVKLDLSIAAEGAYADPLSYRGQGKATVQGPELTKVPMLGLLTKLLPFTELRFTTARADFAIAGKQITFPDVTVTGANSSIDAHGSYTIDGHALDFSATVHPLRESKSLPGHLFSLVLEPLSQLTQVRLTGTPDKPQWTLAANPFNILRSSKPSPLAHPPASVEPVNADGP